MLALGPKCAQRSLTVAVGAQTTFCALTANFALSCAYIALILEQFQKLLAHYERIVLGAQLKRNWSAIEAHSERTLIANGIIGGRTIGALTATLLASITCAHNAPAL